MPAHLRGGVRRTVEVYGADDGKAVELGAAEAV
jgi:hypothetical protein